MLKKTHLLAILAGVTLLAAGCGKKDGKIPEKDLVPILADLYVGEAYFQNPDGSMGYSRDSIGMAILETHGYSVEQLDSTLGWYGRNLDDYSILYVKVDAELDKRMKNVSKRGGTGETQDTHQDLWPYNRFLRFNQYDLSRGFSFSLPIADIPPGGVVDWKVRNVQSVQLDMLLGVEYDNGESHYLTSNVYGSRASGISLPTDTGMMVKRIFGLLRSPSSQLERGVLIDSISLRLMPPDSTDSHGTRPQKKYLLRKRPAPVKTQATGEKAEEDSTRIVSSHSEKEP